MLAQGFPDPLGVRGADALVDGQRLLPVRGAVVVVAVPEQAVAEPTRARASSSRTLISRAMASARTCGGIVSPAPTRLTRSLLMLRCLPSTSRTPGRDADPWRARAPCDRRGDRGYETALMMPVGWPDRTCGWVIGRVVGPSHMSIEPGSAGSKVRGTQLASSSIRRTPNEYS